VGFLWLGMQRVGVASAAATIAVRTTTDRIRNDDHIADGFLHYKADYRVLICKEHGYALRSLSTHLRDQHSIPAKARKAIVAKYNSYSLPGPKEIPLPPPFGRPFEALAAPVEAFLCDAEECGFISKNRSVVAQHCNQAHGWRSSKKDPEHWTDVKVQTFFTRGGFQRYFTVHVPEEQEQETRRAELGDCEGFVAATLGAWKKTDEDYERSQEVADARTAKTDRTGWFNRTAWPEHIAKRNLTLLAHARRLPDRDEKELQRVAHAVDLLTERCVAGLSTLALETRRWLKSAKREEVDVRPMGRLQNPESQKRYARYWKQFVCYCLRIVAAEEEEGIADAPDCRDNSPACGGGSGNSGDDDGYGDGNAGGRNAGDDDASQIEGDDNSDDDDCEDNSEDDGPDSEAGTDKDGAKFLWDARSLF